MTSPSHQRIKSKFELYADVDFNSNETIKKK